MRLSRRCKGLIHHLPVCWIVVSCLVVQFFNFQSALYLISDMRRYTTALRWRCANLMRFITLQVALFSSNSILYRRAPVCIVFVYRYTSIIASFSHEVLANVEQRARPV